MMQPAPSNGPRLLFASYHCFLDPSSGAAIATRDLLELLQTCGWSTRVLCGPKLDFEQGESLVQILSDQAIPVEQKTFAEGSLAFSLLHFRQNETSGTIYSPSPSSPNNPARDEGEAFLALYERLLDQYQPHVVLTYGGQWVGYQMMQIAERRDIRVVFALHNFAYNDARFFSPADAILVPSQFCAGYYHRKLGIDCTPIPSPLNWERIRSERNEQRYVTFVNPQPNKGVFIFARIAYELGGRRPDIPLLVVEGRGGVNWLNQVPLDLSGLENLNVMANTPDPRDFYRVSHMILMPSLWNESFGRVAAESQINGIPVLSSNRGALPEILSQTGFLFEVPARYTSRTTRVPSAREIAPWIETIVQLWDDEQSYQRHSQSARQEGQRWQPERIAARHDSFFRKILR